MQGTILYCNQALGIGFLEEMAVVARDNVATLGEFTNVCKCHGGGVLRARAIPFEEGFPSSEAPEACLRSQQQHINKKQIPGPLVSGSESPEGVFIKCHR